MKKFNLNRGIFWAWIFMLTLDFVTVKMGAASRRSGSSRVSSSSHASSTSGANKSRSKVGKVLQADFNVQLPNLNQRSGGSSTIRSSASSRTFHGFDSSSSSNKSSSSRKSFHSFNSSSSSSRLSEENLQKHNEMLGSHSSHSSLQSLSTGATEPRRQSLGAQTQEQQSVGVAGGGGAHAAGGRSPGFALPPSWETRGVQATQGNPRPYRPNSQGAISQSSVARVSPREKVGPILPPGWSKGTSSGTGTRSFSDGAPVTNAGSLTSVDYEAAYHHQTSVMGTQWGSTLGREASVVSTKMASQSPGSITPSTQTVSNSNRDSIFREAIQRQEQGQDQGGSTHLANQPKRAPEGKSFSEYTNAEMLGYIRNQRAQDPSAASMWDQVEKMWNRPIENQFALSSSGNPWSFGASASARGPQGPYSPSLWPSQNAAPASYSLGAFSALQSPVASSALQLTSSRGSGQGKQRTVYPPMEGAAAALYRQLFSNSANFRQN